MDNALSCDVMARKVGELLIRRYNITYTDDQRVRCCGHVINLVSQDILAALKEGVPSDIEDYYEEARQGPIHLDPDHEPMLTEFDIEEEEICDQFSDAETEEAELAWKLRSISAIDNDDNDNELNEVLASIGPISKVNLT